MNLQMMNSIVIAASKIRLVPLSVALGGVRRRRPFLCSGFRTRSLAMTFCRRGTMEPAKTAILSNSLRP